MSAELDLDDVAAQSELAKRELDALRKDAERYRWLRNNPQWIGLDSDYRPDEIDAEIDKVRAAQEVA